MKSQIWTKDITTILFILTLFHLLQEGQSKVQSCREKFRDQDWIYCTKFGVPPTGIVFATVQARLVSQYKKNQDTVKVTLGQYADEIWERMQDRHDLKCLEKQALALHNTVRHFDVPMNGDWSQTQVIQYSTSMPEGRPQIWYFVAMDCDHNTHGAHKGLPKIEIQLAILNNGSQFSYEESGQLTLHLVLLGLFSILFGTTIFSYIKYYKENMRYDSPHFILVIALFCQISGIFCQWIHLLMFSYDGKGIAILDILSLINNLMAEIAISSLLLMIASGWTITFQDLDWDNNLEFYLPIGAIMIAIHLVLAAMTYIDVDASHKYHDFAGTQGVVLIVLKLFIFGFFIYCYYQTSKKVPKRSEGFYKIFIVLGTLYTLSVPLTIMGSYLFPPYHRQFLYSLGTNMTQILTTGYLLQQQLASKSTYNKASLTSQGILPMDKLE